MQNSNQNKSGLFECKLIPMLFSTMMVQAILRLIGPKLVTRREIVSRSQEMTALMINILAGADVERCKEELIRCHSPYNKGDILWVREEHYRYGRWVADGLTKKKKQIKYRFVEIDSDVQFEPSLTVEGVTFHLEVEPNTYRLPAWYKRLGRFLPKKYCRTWLQVKSVKAELLHEITEEQVILEGVESVAAYKALWIKLNGQESWDNNGLVWVIGFERTEKPMETAA
jgi:hypothetical protein